MSSIGSYGFIKLAGPQIPAFASLVEVINRTNTDGDATRVHAKKSDAIRKTSIAWVNGLTAANALVDSYAALQGNLVTVVEDQGRTVTNVRVLKGGQNTRIQAMIASVPANYTHQVTAEWELKPTLIQA